MPADVPVFEQSLETFGDRYACRVIGPHICWRFDIAQSVVAVLYGRVCVCGGEVSVSSRSIGEAGR